MMNHTLNRSQEFSEAEEKITTLADGVRNVITNQIGMGKVAVRYYKVLLSFEKSTRKTQGERIYPPPISNDVNQSHSIISNYFFIHLLIFTTIASAWNMVRNKKRINHIHGLIWYPWNVPQYLTMRNVASYQMQSVHNGQTLDGEEQR
ncbi:hypothetical protein SADUNF_Sadunf15G0048500 [Salix dunnii]|uniref:Uncharacterized protein n=1 Tax=Salix dunnii TaxID=1413687 RepID=A0A835JDI9_9ROSI|nr:hypothetical protein SADUNF_Sadunf15G0048500 [Salix dunnii]